MRTKRPTKASTRKGRKVRTNAFRDALLQLQKPCTVQVMSANKTSSRRSAVSSCASKRRAAIR